MKIAAEMLQSEDRQVNYMKLKRLTAALIAAMTAITPLSLNSTGFLTPSAVFAEQTGAAAALPDWIPDSFDSAVDFRNTYGATHIDDGLICIVLLNENCSPTDDMLRYDIVTAENTMDTLSRKVYSSDMTGTKLEVIVYKPLVQGDIEADIVDIMIQAPSPDLGYRHATGYYTFTVENDFSITETDIYSWLPDSTKEFGDYVRKNGEVSVKDNYVVFCTVTIEQFGDRWEPNSTNKNEIIKPILTSDCTMQVRDMYCDGSVDQIYVYQAVQDGTEKISWTRTSGARPDPDEPTTYTMTADCAVLDNAQTILLSGQLRATLADFDTGEKIVLSEGQTPYIWTYISDGESSAGPILVMETNPAIVSNDLGGFSDSKSFSFGLEERNLPDGYSFTDDEKRPGYYSGTILPDNCMTVTRYDNGSADVVFKLKFTPTGDANDDGSFSAADVVLLQKWLLAVPDAQLKNWKAVDFYNDNKLNAVDLSLMKQALLAQPVPDYVEPEVRLEYPTQFTVKADGLKLYLGPDESFESVASVPAGSRLFEIGYQKDNNYWLFTQYDGRFGWIRAYEDDNMTLTVIFTQLGFGKPVIYLYPEQETDVHVELELTESELYTTYPKYNDGWDVTAYPDGTLVNKADGTHHRYLFWDSVNCRTRFDYSKGFCVPGSDTERFLKEKLTYMGLNEEEMNEFIIYWLPKLEHNAYNLIAFQDEAYTNTVKMTITPAPDSECRIFMAYVPLEEPVEIEPQELKPFERTGFAVVEWGGAEILP